MQQVPFNEFLFYLLEKRFCSATSHIQNFYFCFAIAFHWVFQYFVAQENQLIRSFCDKSDEDLYAKLKVLKLNWLLHRLNWLLHRYRHLRQSVFHRHSCWCSLHSHRRWCELTLSGVQCDVQSRTIHWWPSRYVQRRRKHYSNHLTNNSSAWKCLLKLKTGNSYIYGVEYRILAAINCGKSLNCLCWLY